MANEFIARKGLIVSGSATVTGSLNVSGGITGSLFGTGSWANNTVSSSYALTSSVGLVAKAVDIISGSIGDNLTQYTGSLFGTSSVAISASYALTASYALNGGGGGTGVGFPFSGSAVITGSLLVSSSGIQAVGSGFTGSLFGTSSWAETSSIALKLPVYTGSGTIQDTQYTGSFTGSLTGTATSASYAITSSYALNSAGAGFPFSGSAIITGSLLVSSSGIQAVGSGFTGSLFGTSSWAANATTSSFATTASAATSITFTPTSASFATTASAATSITFTPTTASFATTASAATSITFTPSTASYATTASNLTGGTANYIPLWTSATAQSSSNLYQSTGNIGIGTTSPNKLLSVNGNANITGSLDVTGAFTAQTKSFKILHQRLPGKSLVYGVLEGPEHAVYARGRLKGSTIITLSEEWEWLVDMDSVTVNLTPIGTHQKLYVDGVYGTRIVVGNDSILHRDIDCYYTVIGTRKDVRLLKTVE